MLWLCLLHLYINLKSVALIWLLLLHLYTIPKVLYCYGFLPTCLYCYWLLLYYTFTLFYNYCSVMALFQTYCIVVAFAITSLHDSKIIVLSWLLLLRLYVFLKNRGQRRRQNRYKSFMSFADQNPLGFI